MGLLDNPVTNTFADGLNAPVVSGKYSTSKRRVPVLWSFTEGVKHYPFYKTINVILFVGSIYLSMIKYNWWFFLVAIILIIINFIIDSFIQ